MHTWSVVKHVIRMYKSCPGPSAQNKRIFDVGPDGLQSKGSATRQHIIHVTYPRVSAQSASHLNKVELNWRFLMAVYASFGAVGLPPGSFWKDSALQHMMLLFAFNI